MEGLGNYAQVKVRHMGWLNEHLEQFVKPVLGYVPVTTTTRNRYLSSQEMARVKNIWRSVKSSAAGKPILLAGRDVFIFEILARRENFPTIFRPDISRLTCQHVTEDYSDCFLFDTGFAGSIPLGLRVKEFILASSLSNRLSVLDKKQTQVFPKMGGSRSLALKIESLPKYWKRAFFSEGGIKQELSDLMQFTHAAYLTIEIYRDSSSKFDNSPMISYSWQDSKSWIE